jgi:hypothetical protein
MCEMRPTVNGLGHTRIQIFEELLHLLIAE